MASILDLDRPSFFAALDELGIQGPQRDDLIRQYRVQSAGILGPAMSSGDVEAGRVRADILPMTRPAGMTGLEAIRSGEAELALPGFITGLLSGGAQAVDAPRAVMAGEVPAADLMSEALNMAGMTSLGGAAMPAPADALRMGALRIGQPFIMRGSDYFDEPRRVASRRRDPALYTPYSATKHQTAPYDFVVEGRSTGNLIPSQQVAPEGLLGRTLYFATGDRTSNQRLIDRVNDTVLPDAPMTYGGPEYMDQLDRGVWASEPAAMRSKHNIWSLAEQLGEDPLIAYMAMGERSGDFSKHMSEVYGAMVQNAPMGHNMRTQIDSVIRDRFPNLSGFKGVNDPEFPQWLAGLKGGDRAKLIKFFDSSVAQELGMPDVSAARFAITNPDLVTSDALSVGYRFGTPAEGAPFRRSTDHPSYGAYVERAPGTTSMTLGGDVPWTIAARDTALPKAAVQGDIRALPKDIKSYMGNPQLKQQIDQQWVDETSRYLELLRERGIDAADVYAQGLLGQFMAR